MVYGSLCYLDIASSLNSLLEILSLLYYLRLDFESISDFAQILVHAVS